MVKKKYLKFNHRGFCLKKLRKEQIKSKEIEEKKWSRVKQKPMKLKKGNQ